MPESAQPDFHSSSDFSHLEELDKHKIFDAIGEQPNQLMLNFADSMYADAVPAQGQGIESVVMAGMGGSALAGNVIKNWLYARINRPFEVVRGYDVPGYVNQRSVVIISSQSGNTEETVAACEQALKQNANVFIMASGGKLVQIAAERNLPLLQLPQVLQPRLGVLAQLKALACLFEDLGFVDSVDLRRELQDAGNWLNEQKYGLSPDAEHGNIAKDTALKLAGKPVIVYGTPVLGSAAYKWKINFNETGKQLAWYNNYSELNHNEYQGWLFPREKDLAAVQLTSSLDNDRIKKRVEITTRILSEHGFNPVNLEARGQTVLQQLLYTILVGDYTAAYVGILNGVDPAPVDLVEQLKHELG